MTGFAEALDGRVKTLHPAVHAGLLADLRLESHEAQLLELGIAPFELVVVNLYPFVQTVASGAPASDIVEQIDIGGPAMVRASAKNHANVAIVVDPARYPQVIAALEAGGTTLAQRQALGAEAFRHTASYDVNVASWIGNVVAPDDDGTGFPGWLGGTWTRQQSLRYGENSHQPAALYAQPRGRRHRPGRASCTARRCRTTTTSTPTPRCARPSTSPSPPSPSSSTRTPAASPWRLRMPLTPSPRPTSGRTPATPCRPSAA